MRFRATARLSECLSVRRRDRRRARRAREDRSDEPANKMEGLAAAMSKSVRMADLRGALARLPRVPLAHLPTPLEPAPRLSSALGGTTIYVKRDDLTGLALGGNKVRQLEYLLGEAVHAGATAVVTGAGVDSNHCRQLAAACAKLGLRACLILRGERPARMEGNLLLDTIFGAESGSSRRRGSTTSLNRLRVAGRRRSPRRANGRMSSTRWGGTPTRSPSPRSATSRRPLSWRSSSRRSAGDRMSRTSALARRLRPASRWHGRALTLPYRLVGISASPFIPDKPTVIAQVAMRAAAAPRAGSHV